jgi:UDP-2-acetamido-2-deoxy-ribo-hexuluronate aminotransferase
MPDLDAISLVAAKHGLAVIEDGAQSFGASRHGSRSCGVTPLGITSFFPSKPLGCYGDGGALFTSDDALARSLRTLRSHGAERRGEHHAVGLNGRLDTLQAAVLLAKLPQLERDLAERRRLAARYTASFAATLRTPLVAAGNEHVFAQYTLLVANRDALRAKLLEQGIEAAIYYSRPLHRQPVFARLHGAHALPCADAAAAAVLSLPLYPTLSDNDQDRILDVVSSLISKTLQ